MKKFYALILAAALCAASLTACNQSTSGSETTTAESTDASSAETSAAAETDAENAGTDALTIKDGVLMVGLEIGYPPMEYLDTDGTTPIGFDVEMSKAIAEKMGLQVELVDTAWDGIFSSLDSSRYDCVISSVSITPERSEAYNLTEPYIANKICIVTGVDSGITSPDELAGKKVCTQTETTSDYFMRDLMTNGLAVSADDYGVYDKVIYCFEELKNGRVDAVVVDSVVASYYIGSDSDKYKVVWTNPEAEPLAIAVKKGNDELTTKIEEAVDALYADGTVATIAEKYFGADNEVAVER